MNQQMFTADGAEVLPNLYIQDGRTLYKVSTVYETSITAQVCWEKGQIPGRTTVRTLPRHIVTGSVTPSDKLVERYHAALDA
jgi:uncharacterized protein (DUF2126 family)